MAPRPRSPNYPNLSLPDAIARVRRVFDQDRRAPLDREVRGQAHGVQRPKLGASDKTIGSIMQYGLLERVGKGEKLRVAQIAVDIYHPDNPADRRRALLMAALTPPLFRSLRERFPQSVPSAEALRCLPRAAEFLGSGDLARDLRLYGDLPVSRARERMGKRWPAAQPRPRIGSDELEDDASDEAPDGCNRGPTSLPERASEEGARRRWKASERC